MFVNVTLKGISDTETIEKTLTVSEPLQRLVQKHNRIAFVNNSIDIINKDFTGAQLKSELEKHDSETLIGLLHEYITITKIFINSNTIPDDPNEHPKRTVQVEIKEKQHINDNGDEIIIVEKKYTETDNESLRSTDKKNLKIYLIKTAINLFAAGTLMLIGSVMYIAWNAKEMPNIEIVNTLFKTTTEIVKFIILPSK